MSPRSDLLSIFHYALAAVNGRRVVREHLAAHPWDGTPPHVIAIGKAAASMALGARDALGAGLSQVLVITKYGHLDPELRTSLPEALVMEAGHPLPDANSLRAGRRLLNAIDAAPPQASFLFLISGGASALVEALPPGLEPEDLDRAHRWLSASGLPIAVLNRIRKALSVIKGGRLAARLRGRTACQLLISDVPDDDPATIGSGLLTPESQPPVPLPGVLPAWLGALMQRGPSPPPRGDPCFGTVQTRILADSARARAAAAERARALGYAVHAHADIITGGAREAGEGLAAALIAGPPGIHLWGGETVVHLPETPGMGGRCQTLALAAAQRIAGRPDIMLLAAGTDGGDGTGPAAGALVDGGTIERGTRRGLDANVALARADTGTFLQASDDLIETGPTGTNVMDLTLAYRQARSSD